MDLHTLQFIEFFLYDTLLIDFHYFKSPFSDISMADRYLRKGLIHSEELYSIFASYFSRV